ncbi:MAG: DUF2721 domain-containing protein [Planctomycetes bacterium]|nr:DUF2721 domain-containing protein [Planctomycetota bacterium]
MAPEPVQFIAELVTPAVMVSAAGLLLLGLHSKYSNIVTRVRSIIDRRAGFAEANANDPHIENLTKQIGFLMRRAWCARNAIVCLYVSILFMIATSLCDAMVRFGILPGGKVPVAIFCLGIVSLFIGCVFALIEVQFAYRVISLEVERHEGNG